MVLGCVDLAWGCFFAFDRFRDGWDGRRSAPIEVEENVRIRFFEEEGSRDAIVRCMKLVVHRRVLQEKSDGLKSRDRRI